MAFEKIDEHASGVVIAVNPKSGFSNRDATVRKLVEILSDAGLEPHVSSEVSSVTATASQLMATRQLRAVVAAGGDGTVALLANQLRAEVPLAILPLGTENLLAKHLQLTADPEHIARTILTGNTVRMDAGRANGKLFLVMASCGFDADVVRRLHTQRTGHIHRMSYAKPILDAIARYRYPTIRIWVDECDKPVSSKWAFVFNVPRYAMNLQLVPEADSMDGQLDLCTFRGGNLARGLVYLTGVIFRQHRNWKDTQVHQARRLRIESEGDVPYQLDGDPGGRLPLDIEVVPGRLRMLVPDNWITPTASVSTISAEEGKFSAQ